jgi:hypothetical protein
MPTHTGEGGVLFSHGPVARMAKTPQPGVPTLSSMEGFLGPEMTRVNDVASRFGTQNPDEYVRGLISTGTPEQVGSNYNVTRYTLDALRQLRANNPGAWARIDQHLRGAFEDTQKLQNIVDRKRWEKEIASGKRKNTPYQEKPYLKGLRPGEGEDILDWLGQYFKELQYPVTTKDGEAIRSQSTPFEDRLDFWTVALSRGAAKGLGVPAASDVRAAMTEPMLADLPQGGWTSAATTVHSGQQPKKYAWSPYDPGHATYDSYLTGPEPSKILQRTFNSYDLTGAGSGVGPFKDTTSHGATRAALVMTPEYIDALLNDKPLAKTFGGFNGRNVSGDRPGGAAAIDGGGSIPGSGDGRVAGDVPVSEPGGPGGSLRQEMRYGRGWSIARA